MVFLPGKRDKRGMTLSIVINDVEGRSPFRINEASGHGAENE